MGWLVPCKSRAADSAAWGEAYSAKKCAYDAAPDWFTWYLPALTNPAPAENIWINSTSRLMGRLVASPSK